MAVLTKEALLAKLKEKFGEDTSDETIQLIEDVSDTVGDFEEKAKDTTDWKKKYAENDETWRKKYRDRFFNTPANDEPELDVDDTEEKPKTYKYEELFKEETK